MKRIHRDLIHRARTVCMASLLATALLAPATQLGCQRQPDPGQRQYPYEVTTTVGMITDIVARVAGDKAAVEGIIGTGVDPHLYRATRDDVARLMSADIVFYNGLLLEGKMADTLVKIASGSRPVIAVTEKLNEQYLLTPPGMQGHHDPHVWMDVKAWMSAIDVVAEALGAFDADNSDLYRRNAEAHRQELARLDDYVRQVIGSIPEQQRILITAHDAFNYFGRAYNIEVMGVQGISTESEAGLQDINRLVDLIVDRKVGAVFIETSVAAKSVQALIEAARTRGQEVNIGGELFSDAMGKPGTYEGTYVGMIDHNATVIARALGGTAPERGMQDKLAPRSAVGQREN